MIEKIKNYIEWGCMDVNEIIIDKDLYNWFYNGPDIDYTSIENKGIYV